MDGADAGRMARRRRSGLRRTQGDWNRPTARERVLSKRRQPRAGSGRPRAFRDEGVAFIIDMTDRKRAEEKLRASEQRLLDAQMELAHVTRVTALGEMTASIAHEVNQPLTGVVTYGGACLRWLDGEVPRIDQARDAVEQMIGSARRASDVIARIRARSRKGAPQTAQRNINEAIDDVLAVIRREINVHGLSLRLDLGTSLPPVDGDRVQLQQVIMNLLMNSIEAMQSVKARPGELL